jgi:hypothetical protein
MNRKIIGMISFLLLILLLTPVINSQYVTKNNNSGKSSIDWHTTFFASIYIKLDSDSSQIEDIINNWNNPPKHFLTNIDIIIPDANYEDGNMLFIHPLRSVIGDWFDLDSFFDPISPKETTLVYISVLWCDLHDLSTDIESHEEFVIEGIGPLISWRS